MSGNVFTRINWKQVGLIAACAALFSAVSSWMLKPDMIDYVNVALLPDLAEELGTDLTTQLQLASIGTQVLRAAQGFGTVQSPGGDVDDQVLELLAKNGEEVFDLLTVEQRKVFFRMFRSRELLPIEYHTEASDVPDVPRYFLTFGWKRPDQPVNQSIRKTAERLERSWELIPSKKVAQSLASHSSSAVSEAAGKWLSENAPRKARRSRPSFEERGSAMRASHEERVREMRRDHDRRVARNRADHERRVAESRASAAQGSANRKADFERRRAQMRADHEKRAAEMRAEHERRVEEMRKR